MNATKESRNERSAILINERQPSHEGKISQLLQGEGNYDANSSYDDGGNLIDWRSHIYKSESDGSIGFDTSLSSLKNTSQEDPLFQHKESLLSDSPYFKVAVEKEMNHSRIVANLMKRIQNEISHYSKMSKYSVKIAKQFSGVLKMEDIEYRIDADMQKEVLGKELSAVISNVGKVLEKMAALQENVAEVFEQNFNTQLTKYMDKELNVANCLYAEATEETTTAEKHFSKYLNGTEYSEEKKNEHVSKFDYGRDEVYQICNSRATSELQRLNLMKHLAVSKGKTNLMLTQHFGDILKKMDSNRMEYNLLLGLVMTHAKKVTKDTKKSVLTSSKRWDRKYILVGGIISSLDEIGRNNDEGKDRVKLIEKLYKSNDKLINITIDQSPIERFMKFWELPELLAMNSKCKRFANEGVVMEGWLYKKTGTSLKTRRSSFMGQSSFRTRNVWSRHWYILKKGGLYLLRPTNKESESFLIEKVCDITVSTLQEVGASDTTSYPPVEYRYCFEVETNDQTEPLSLQAMGPYEYKMWTSGIQSTMNTSRERFSDESKSLITPSFVYHSPSEFLVRGNDDTIVNDNGHQAKYKCNDGRYDSPVCGTKTKSIHRNKSNNEINDSNSNTASICPSTPAPILVDESSEGDSYSSIRASPASPIIAKSSSCHSLKSLHKKEKKKKKKKKKVNNNMTLHDLIMKDTSSTESLQNENKKKGSSASITSSLTAQEQRRRRRNHHREMLKESLSPSSFDDHDQQEEQTSETPKTRRKNSFFRSSSFNAIKKTKTTPKNTRKNNIIHSSSFSAGTKTTALLKDSSSCSNDRDRQQEQRPSTPQRVRNMIRSSSFTAAKKAKAFLKDSSSSSFDHEQQQEQIPGAPQVSRKNKVVRSSSSHAMKRAKSLLSKKNRSVASSMCTDSPVENAKDIPGLTVKTNRKSSRRSQKTKIPTTDISHHTESIEELEAKARREKKKLVISSSRPLSGNGNDDFASTSAENIFVRKKMGRSLSLQRIY